MFSSSRQLQHHIYNDKRPWSWKMTKDVWNTFSSQKSWKQCSVHGKHSHLTKRLHSNSEVISNLVPLQISLGVVWEALQTNFFVAGHALQSTKLNYFSFQTSLTMSFACCFGPVAICSSKTKSEWEEKLLISIFASSSLNKTSDSALRSLRCEH